MPELTRSRLPAAKAWRRMLETSITQAQNNAVAAAAKNNLTFNGSGVFNSITTKNNANFFFDTRLGASTGTVAVSSAQ